MRFECVVLGALWVLASVCPSGSMSTCKPLDLELVKKKRLEAIRGQILSKLRLPREPDPQEAGERRAIPDAVMSVYNSTLELSREQGEQAHALPSLETDEEEYFAKEVHKFEMKEKSEYIYTYAYALSLTHNSTYTCYLEYFSLILRLLLFCQVRQK